MESKKRHEERQAKAAELRERFRQEKAEKVKELTKKVSNFWDADGLLRFFPIFCTRLAFYFNKKAGIRFISLCLCPESLLFSFTTLVTSSWLNENFIYRLQVEEVRLFKDKMEEQRREYMDKKLLEAEEKRKRQLKLKVKKAHEEETKVGWLVLKLGKVCIEINSC